MVKVVWIVQHDESPHNTILGVFATQDEAQSFAEGVEEFKDAVLYARYDIGYRCDRGPGHVTFGPGSTNTD
ncbi:hypothetical protein [Cryobacterium psychrophilum]|uniref:Uncharacterized protein n=1 Tax=Cryobacterium psychrophilum TaxID=41988 RepID=A0A4Y8KVG1_9MICO|nr:hypothetical protein [Cryobacterium psychrophilum]TDW28776.1 hypothetical protein EDD25_0410 [Cryobacterium psychrophilum]TFD82427.1 hypothetical protein E3T53_00715 [Cryobacterium psychrophilum]